MVKITKSQNDTTSVVVHDRLASPIPPRKGGERGRRNVVLRGKAETRHESTKVVGDIAATIRMMTDIVYEAGPVVGPGHQCDDGTEAIRGARLKKSDPGVLVAQ